MQQEKRINVFNKETGLLMRVTVSKAKSLESEGYKPTSKGKLRCFLNRERKMAKNEKTLERLGIDINKPDNKNRYFKMPSGKIHVIGDKGQNILVKYPD